MRVILRGYFNHNLGDDFMIKTFIEQTPNVEYVVETDNEYTKFLKNMPNVIFSEKLSNLYPVITVIGSGFMLNSGVALKREIKKLFLGREHSDFYIGCNIEPFKNKFAEFVIRKKVKGCKFVSCRDNASFDWFKKNLTKTRLSCYPDILFSMPKQSLPQVCANGSLGITVMQTGNADTDKRFIEDITQITDLYIQSTNKNVFLFAFSMGTENDYELCKTIQNRVNQKERTKIICYSGDGTELMQNFAKCSKIIAVRFHSAVLAIKLGIPVYPILYRDKMKNLIKDINYNLKGSEIMAINKAEIQKFIVNNQNQYLLDKNIEEMAKNHSKYFLEYLYGKEDA